MSELEALVAVHGAIDRAVQENPALRDVVAPVLPAYARDDTPGWYEKFEGWTKAVAPETPLLPPANALGQLTEPPENPRMAARRLLAIAALARVNRGADDDGDGPLLAALSVAGISEADNSPELLRRLRGDEFESIGKWSQLIEGSVQEGLLSETFRMQAGAPPCSGAVEAARSSAGDDVEAAVLFTSNTAAVAFDRACRFLEASNWPDCSAFWCEMTHVATKPNGNPVYHERVSLDCRNPLAWCAEAYLEFGYSHEPGIASVSYQLDPDRTVATDPIVVDEGWLRVVDNGGGAVTVETLKTIRFANALLFSVGNIAAMMCPLGYNDAAGDLMFNCAAGDAAVGNDFPGAAAEEAEA